MNYETIQAMRHLIVQNERTSPNASRLFAYEEEHNALPNGINVIIPVHNGAYEMADLFISLQNQTLDPDKFEIIFALNACRDESLTLIKKFAKTGNIQTVILESDIPNVSIARNDALKHTRFRYTTFVDHDDHISRNYLKECLHLADYRSVVVSNIMKIEHAMPTEDYAQKVISQGFRVSHVHGPEDIAICYRAYTLNAIKTAPTYMVRRVQYDDTFRHSGDVNYWRDLFRAFTPITVKSPTFQDIYYRTIIPHSISRRDTDIQAKAEPRLKILDRIKQAQNHLPCDCPERKFDVQLKSLMIETIHNLGPVPMDILSCLK